MSHLRSNLSPRGIARRFALGRWDYSTEHIAGLTFTMNFIGRNFRIDEEPVSFLDRRRWVLKRHAPLGFTQVVEISLRDRSLLAASYAVAPAGWVLEQLARDIYVPDDSVASEVMLSGDDKARLILDRMTSHEERFAIERRKQL